MRIPIWAYAIALLSLAFVVQTFRLDHAQKAESALKLSVSIYQSTQDANLKTIDGLELINARWADGAKRQTDNAKYFVDIANEYGQTEQAKATKLQKSLDAIYAKHPESRAWASERIDPSIADSLRANAGSH